MKERGTACWAGKPDAGEAVPVSVGPRFDDDAAAEWGLDVAGVLSAASWVGSPEVMMGSCLSAVLGLGVSTNVIDGPVVSSEEIAVRGVGFDVNFGRDCRRIGDGLTKDFAERCEDELAIL